MKNANVQKQAWLDYWNFVIRLILQSGGIVFKKIFIFMSVCIQTNCSQPSPGSETGQVPAHFQKPIVQTFLICPKNELCNTYMDGVKVVMAGVERYYNDRLDEIPEFAPPKFIEPKETTLQLRCGVTPKRECLSDKTMLDESALGRAAQYIKRPPLIKDLVQIYFVVGFGGYAGGYGYKSRTDDMRGVAVVGGWGLEGITGIRNPNAPSCMYLTVDQQAQFCHQNAATGTAAHELGHTFGLPHPAPEFSNTIMNNHLQYPRGDFYEFEKNQLYATPFFKRRSETIGSGIQKSEKVQPPPVSVISTEKSPSHVSSASTRPCAEVVITHLSGDPHANVRLTPSLDADKVGIALDQSSYPTLQFNIKQGQGYYCDTDLKMGSESWVKIALGGGKSGWIHGLYVECHDGFTNQYVHKEPC